MKCRYLIVMCLAASCAAPPPVHASEDEPESGNEVLGPHLASTAWTLRVGVEYLPPSPAGVDLLGADENDRPSVEPRSAPVRTPGTSGLSVEPTRSLPAEPTDDLRLDRDHHVFWNLDEAKLREIRDPVERATVRLIHDLMGEDRRRIKRRLGTPILAGRHEDLQMPYLPVHVDEKDSEEEDEFLEDEARGLLRRPLRNVLKKSALVQSVEMVLDDFKSEHVPTSQAYQESHPGKVKWGRFSMRGHLNDGSDPLEVRYILNGCRIAASKEKVKAGYQTWLADDLSFEIRSRYDMPSDDWSLRADLVYYVNESTRLHCVAGDNLDFLATSNIYSLFESPMDGSPGLLFFAVHLF